MNGIAETRPAGSSDFGRLEPGFADPVRDAQSWFRAILDAMAHPGRIVKLPVSLAGAPPAPLGSAATSIALALCDLDTPVWLDEAAGAAASYIAFHCGAPLATIPGEARFAFIADPSILPPLDSFALGSDEYPERSATLVIEVAGLTGDDGAVLRGPGIRDEIRLGVIGVPGRFWTERAALAELFPRGLDILFVTGDTLAALPRSTHIAL
jgi:alpha-D-ribose 1-methylphosphonate 5-triphosphate synthase subunit PhnH